jgi:hypothetical protein
MEHNHRREPATGNPLQHESVEMIHRLVHLNSLARSWDV